MTARSGPIACDLTQIPPDTRDRLVDDFRALLASVTEVRSLPEGYALRFAAPKHPGLLSTLGRIVDYDRLCCPFVGHAVIDEPWGGPVWLHLTGTAEVRAFVARELAALPPADVAGTADLRDSVTP